jgi:cytochrome c oxidase subunit II
MHTNILGLSNFCGAIAAWLCLTPVAFAGGPLATSNTPASTSAHQIFTMSLFLIWIAGGIFLVVGGLLAFAPCRFRACASDPSSSPTQVYRATEINLAWTVIPVLVLVLFLA